MKMRERGAGKRSRGRVEFPLSRYVSSFVKVGVITNGQFLSVLYVNINFSYTNEYIQLTFRLRNKQSFMFIIT